VELNRDLHKFGEIIADEWKRNAGDRGAKIIEEYRQQKTAQR
jgi:hypothetical protein